jgi:hypothetical protein
LHLYNTVCWIYGDVAVRKADVEILFTRDGCIFIFVSRTELLHVRRTRGKHEN